MTAMNKPTTRTPREARQWLHDHGRTIREFCAAMGVHECTVKDLFRTKGPHVHTLKIVRGKVWECAVVLGIVPPPPTGPRPPPLESVFAADGKRRVDEWRAQSNRPYTPPARRPRPAKAQAASAPTANPQQ